jgi:hypothetical protein
MSTVNVISTAVPDGSLLAQYENVTADQTVSNYCDCYSTIIDRKVDLQEFVYAFYTSKVFSVERKILATVLRIPTTDEHAKQLSLGNTDSFSAWTVETRLDNEMLLREPRSRTASWFMVRQEVGATSDRTQLLFGSVVFPKNDQKGLGILFHSLSTFHTYYSHALLRSAYKGLHRND